MKRTTHVSVALLALFAGAGQIACGSDDASSEAPVIDPGDGGDYAPVIEPAEFVEVIDNPYLPMPVGARWRYEGESDGELEVVEIVVTPDREEIMGISAVVVRDTVSVDGEVVEDTLDWFAQDGEGNVWYLGEDSKDYEGGEVVSTEGSWRAGVDGALPGIVMPASPEPGAAYRQEYAPGEAEDMMQILELGTGEEVPAGPFDDVLTTLEWTPLEPDVTEEKAYAPGVGKIRESTTEGGDEHVELVEYSLGS